MLGQKVDYFQVSKNFPTCMQKIACGKLTSPEVEIKIQHAQLFLKICSSLGNNVLHFSGKSVHYEFSHACR